MDHHSKLGASPPPPSAGKPTATNPFGEPRLLTDAIETVLSQSDRAHDMADHLHNLADQIFGPRPSHTMPESPVQDMPASAEARLRYANDGLNAALDRLSTALDRLRSLV